MTNELIEGVEYITYVQPEVIGYEEDQVITSMPEHCTSWQCQRWDGDRRIAPILIVNQDGFHVCSACGSSYGRKS